MDKCSQVVNHLVYDGGERGYSAISDTPFATRGKTLTLSSQVRDLAIEKLWAMELSLAEKLSLGKEHRVSKWVLDGLVSLVLARTASSMEEPASIIGWELIAKVFSLRERLKDEELASLKKNSFTANDLWCGICQSQLKLSGDRSQVSCTNRVCLSRPLKVIALPMAASAKKLQEEAEAEAKRKLVETEFHEQLKNCQLS
jgi:hypothetical protein